MFGKLFIEVLNMSYIGGIVILGILFIRLFIKKIPKKFSYILWLVPLYRLLIPFSFESALSLIPVHPEPILTDIAYAVSSKLKTSVASVDYFSNNIVPDPEKVTSVSLLQIVILRGTMIWVIVMMGLMIYGFISYIKLKKILSDANFIGDNVYSSNNINSPFVIGIINPKIYLPGIVRESEKEYIRLHEQTHIKRFDPLFRCIGFFVLCLHWFNPFVWIAYYVSGNYMEMSCDEIVITKLGDHVKKEYSQSLLNFTARRFNFSMASLAFGEGNIKGRIKNVLKFQKPKTYFIIVAIITVIISSIGLLLNPVKNNLLFSLNGSTYGVVNILFESPIYSFSYNRDTAPSFRISSDYWLYTKEKQYDWEYVGSLYETNMEKEELFTWIHFKDLLDEKTINLIDEVKTIYSADTADNHDIFYLVLETKEHQILILYGYTAEESASIRWIFEVKKL